MDKRRLALTQEYLRALDLDAGAGIADIREAYRNHVRAWNPANPDFDPKLRAATERKLAEAQQAYEWLKANGEAVVAQAKSETGPPSNKRGAKSAPPFASAGWLLYGAFIGLLVAGIWVIARVNPNAWLGPLV